MYLQAPELQEAPLATCRVRPKAAGVPAEGSVRHGPHAGGSPHRNPLVSVYSVSPGTACSVLHDSLAVKGRGGGGTHRGTDRSTAA